MYSTSISEKRKKKDGFKKKSTLPATPSRPTRVADVAVIGTPVAESPEVRDVPWRVSPPPPLVGVTVSKSYGRGGSM